VVAAIKKEIDRTPIKGKGKIKRSIRYKVLPDSILIQSDHPAFYLDTGVKPYTMVYVRNRVIPIELDVLEKPTPKDVRQGVGFRTIKAKPPKHPGYDALDFVKKGVLVARKQFFEEMLEGMLG